MIRPRIRAVRQQRKMTLQQLADAVGSTVSTVQRLERGEVDLVHELLPKIAETLGVEWRDLLDGGHGPAAAVPSAGLAESAAAFTPAAGHDLARMPLGDNEAMFEVRDDQLSAIGIRKGDVIIADCSRAAVRGIATGDVVVAQAYGPEMADAVTIVREYVAPGLLVTNPLEGLPAVLSTSAHDVAIKGVARRRFAEMRPVR